MVARKIGTVARELQLSERRIREWEHAGLLRPRREPKTGDRLFDDRDIAQAHIIKSLIHEKGFTIRAAQQLLRYAPCWELTNCELKASCPAYLDPRTPCYEHRANATLMPCRSDCARCPVFHSKDAERPRVVLPPHT